MKRLNDAVLLHIDPNDPTTLIRQQVKKPGAAFNKLGFYGLTSATTVNNGQETLQLVYDQTENPQFVHFSGNDGITEV